MYIKRRMKLPLIYIKRRMKLPLTPDGQWLERESVCVQRITTFPKRTGEEPSVGHEQLR